MHASGTGSRLIIVCGLPGSGKTTHAKALERSHRAIRFAPDEWMNALSIDIYDEEKRGQIEALQWKLSQELLAHGLIRGSFVPPEPIQDLRDLTRTRKQLKRLSYLATTRWLRRDD